jgi:hypothetical protein
MTRADWSTRFLTLILAGPMIWAVTFSLVYALHGAGCAWGWPEAEFGPLSLHRLAMLAAWGAGLLVCASLLAALPRGPGLRHWLPRACTWIGLGATLFTLFPVVVATSC